MKRPVRAWLARFGTKRTIGNDLRAGLVLGIEAVPDGLAAGLLAGVNPVLGLYGYMVGMFTGALVTGSVFMTLTATGAMAVIVSDVPEVHGARQTEAVAMLALLAGLIMLALGLFRLGSMVRFIPTAVLVGFVNAVAITIILGQVGNLTSYAGEGENRIVRTVDTLLNAPLLNWWSVLIGFVTIGLILLLERTFLGPLALVVAVVAGSALCLLPVFATVPTLADLVDVPRALPMPAMPAFDLIFALVLPAASLAFVALVQGAGISGSIPNPDGRYADASADFRGQGIANLAVGVLQGMPVGGSMSATAIVRTAGARSALANLVAGAVMAIVVLLLGSLIGYVAMPALAGLLILVGFRTLKIHDLVMVWRTGVVQATIVGVTFTLTLLIPLQFAVLVGVGLAIVLHVVDQSNRVVVRRWIFEGDDPRPIEVDPPTVLDAGEIVVLTAYGSLFFASAPVVEQQFPEVVGRCDGAAIILRLRGKDEIGNTFIRVLRMYAERLDAAGGALYVVGVGPRVMSQLIATDALAVIGADRVFPAGRRVGESTARAIAAAELRASESRGDADAE